MTEVNVHAKAPEPEDEGVYTRDDADSSTVADTNFVAVLIALVVLVALLALMFYALPNWLGTGSVNTNIRAP
jgi:hypothetical protein